MNHDSKVIIYRKTGTASTFLMNALDGVYATTPLESIDLSKDVFNTEYPNVVRYLLDAFPNHRFTIITTVRNPYTRHVSQFFKNYANAQIKSPVDGRMVPNPFRVRSPYAFRKWSDVFRRANLAFCCKYDAVIEDSYEPLFGLLPPRFGGEYGFCQNDRFKLLVMRQEEIRQWGRITKATLDMDVAFASRKINASDDRADAEYYRQFCANYDYDGEERRIMNGLGTARRYYRDKL